VDLTDPRTFTEPVTGAWRCVACGTCCRQIPIHPTLVALDLDRGDGTCRHLQDDQSCGIYETRPAGCRVPVEHYPRMPAGCARVNELGPIDQARLDSGLADGSIRLKDSAP